MSRARWLRGGGPEAVSPSRGGGPDAVSALRGGGPDAVSASRAISSGSAGSSVPEIPQWIVLIVVLVHGAMLGVTARDHTAKTRPRSLKVSCKSSMSTGRRYEPDADRAAVAGGVGARARLGGPRTTRRAGMRSAEGLRARDAPVPSGELHMGHVLNYTLGDVVSHVRRRAGQPVLHPMGTTRSGCPPRTPRSGGRAPTRGDRTDDRCESGRIHGWGIRSTGRARSRPTSPSTTAGHSGSSSSCSRRPGLPKDAPVKWCPFDQTVLANEQVIDGRCERCGNQVEARKLEQWMFRITDYADRLLDDLDKSTGPSG